MEFYQIEKSPVIIGWVRNMITRFGIYVTLYAESKEQFTTTIDPLATDTINSVYGVYAGTQKLSPPTMIKVLFPPSNFSVSDAFFESSILDTVNLYTLDSVQNGDIMEVPRDDDHILRYKLVQCETIGQEANLITRFRITALAE
jgi:hypothetical protein